MDAFMTRGPNQHYIPKFLQGAFGVPPKRHQIWYFERGSAPKKRPIKRTASQAHFYSDPQADGEPTLDDTITDFESDLAAILQSIRRRSDRETVDSNAAAEVIQHLALRTAHLRDTLNQGLTRLIETAADEYASPDNVKALAGLDTHLPNEDFREGVLAKLVQQPQIARANLPKRTLERYAFCIARENLVDIVRDARPAIRSALSDVVPQFGGLIREHHNQLVAEHLKPEQPDALLLGLHWTVDCALVSGAILPDFVVMAIHDDGTVEPYIYSRGRPIRAVIMPITPSKLLVGRRNGYSIGHGFDYNLKAAQACQTFFLSSKCDPETSRLQPMIGAQRPAAVEEIIDATVLELPTRKADERSISFPERHPPETGSTREPAATFGYDIWLIECADQEGTARLGQAIQTIVSALSQTLPLGRLDGITIARDYPAAAKAVDRGFDTGIQLESVSPDIGVGIAQTITIIRSGLVKARIVMADSVAHDLISRDSKRVGWATHVLVSELAQVGMIDAVERAFPGMTLERPGTKLDRGLYAILDPGLHVHVASCIAAGFGDREAIANSLRDYLARSLDTMMSRVSQEKLAYRHHQDLGRLTTIAFSVVRHVLILAAQLLGHCAAADISPTCDDHEISDSLDRADLTKWFRTYESDLERFRNRLGHWTSFDEFMDFNIHVERLLWHLGIITSEDGERCRIDVLK